MTISCSQDYERINMIIVVLFITLILFLYLLYKSYYNKFKDVNKLPGPSPFDLIREVYLNRSSAGLIHYLQTLNEKYGPVVKLWLNPLKPIIITTDMDYCNKIFKNNDHHISPGIAELSFAGEGMSTTKNYNIWRTDKSIIMKAITREYITNRLSVYDKEFDKFLEIIRGNAGKPIDVQAHLHKHFLNIMLKSFDHPHVNITQDEEHYRNFRKRFFDLLLEKMNSIRMLGILHKFSKNFQLMSKCSRELQLFADTWLENFKKVEKHKREKHNLVYAMMEGGIPDRRIADNITTIIQGGNDTPTYPLSLTFLEMLKRPELQENVRAEIVSVLGSGMTTPITLDHLDEMHYLHAIVKESLRMYIPFPFLDRELLYDFTIKNVRIPKATRVMFNIPGILRSELNYDDPLTFNPDRFLKEKLTMREKKAYLAFGYGLKICPGKDIAYATMKLLLVKIIREFEICPLDEEYKLDIKADLIYRSLNGIPIVFRKKGIK